MAEFLTTHATAYQLENIILKAKSSLVLVSPYLQVSKTFMDRLNDADERGIEIQVIFGKDELKPDEKYQLNQLKNLSLLFCENLHAKCYFNEDTMVITSMNMYEFSEKRNREMGVLINRVNDSKVYEDAMQEIQSIARASVKQELSLPRRPQPVLTETAVKSPPGYTKNLKPDVVHQKPEPSFLDRLGQALGMSEQKGYCIRSGEPIAYDVSHPLCIKHQEAWNEYRDPDYKEHYCHRCGEKYRTSFRQPLCRSCQNEIKS
jgi:phosphatidylserine/phosphatidylglycerophosphate/cardiolipin synthase-like enzyme